MKRNGARGMEFNLIKTRQEAKVDFSSTVRPLMDESQRLDESMVAELPDRAATGFLGPVHAQP
jgi:hypothetical protein